MTPDRELASRPLAWACCTPTGCADSVPPPVACEPAASDPDVSDEVVAQVVGVCRALSDPIRVRMLGLMALGRGCCELPDCDVPAPAAADEGICVCEFSAYYGLGQSKVSYHLRILKEAGLIRESERGKWTFYALNRKALKGMLATLAELVTLRTKEEPDDE